MSIDQDSWVGRAAALEAADPDAGLVAVLDDVEPASLTGAELAAYVRARWRVHNRSTARFLEALHHLGRAEAGRTDRRPGLDDYSGDEVSATLGWSRTMATRKLDLADDLAQRLPEIGDALDHGRLDEPKARTLCDWTRDLADDHAHHVCRVVLSEAPELPVGALIERIEEVAMALDPDWAERRRKRAESRARVILSPNPSGTATLSLCDAPAPDAIASQARVDALAASIRQLGVLTPIAALRLHVATRLLDGSTAGMDDRTIALLLAAEYHAEPGDDGTDGPDDDRPDDGPRDDLPPAGPAPDPEPAPQQGVLELRGLPDVADVPDTPERPLGRDPRPGRVREGTVEIRLRLTTALGLDEHPGSVPGYGTVLPRDARAMAVQRRTGEWRVVLTGPDGHLEYVLLPRRRPPVPRDRGRRRARGRSAVRTASIVEIRVPTTLLAALVPADHGGWAPMLTELQHRLGELRGAAAPGRVPDGDADDDALARRRPGAELDRWIRVRDRCCVAPFCRRPAFRAELDHTVAHARGGPTSSWNLGAWCPHHHRAKHHAGWRVRQPSPGRFIIRTRSGVRHISEPEAVLAPLPAPRPAVRPRPLPDDGWCDDPEPVSAVGAERVSPSAAGRRARRPPPPQPPTDPLDDTPPF